MSIKTTTNIHHATAVVVEEHKLLNKGRSVKWLSFSIKDEAGHESAEFSVFDLELADLVTEPDNRPEAVITDFMKGFVEAES